MQEYVFTLIHNLVSAIKLKGVKFTTTPPYASGTPQYSIDSGLWLDLIVDPMGGWKIPGPFFDDALGLPAGPHTLEVRDGSGTYNISSFTLLTNITACLTTETLTVRVPELFVAMSSEQVWQEYSLDGGAATPINNDPFQVFELGNLPADDFDLVWIVTIGSPCSGASQNFTNPLVGPPTPPGGDPAGKFGLKIPWQYWLSLAGVPDVFFDDTKPNNGQNLNSSNYSEKEGFELKVAIVARVRQDGIDTIYEHKSQPIVSSFYQEEPTGVDDWVSCSIETFNSLGNSLGGGLLLNGEPTTIKATFAPTAPIDINQFYGVIRLQETEQPGEDIWEASTLHGIAPGSPLNVCSKADVGGNIVLTCETIPANLTSSEWTISAKIDYGFDAVLGDYFHQDYSPIDYLVTP